jgi:Ulp1 family protease
MDDRDENPEIFFEGRSFERLRHRRWLNRDCVSTLAAFLVYELTNPALSGITHYETMCGVFDSQAFSYVERGTFCNLSLYNWCKGAKFWKRPVWLIPIHRKDHWVLAVVCHNDQRIYMYDSFGQCSKKAWEREVEVSDLHGFVGLVA